MKPSSTAPAASGEAPFDGDALVHLPRRKTVRRPLPPEGAYSCTRCSTPTGESGSTEATSRT